MIKTTIISIKPKLLQIEMSKIKQ